MSAIDPRSLPETVEGLREAWAVIEGLWPPTYERAKRLPPSVVNDRVDDEWSFLETLRHLLFATDVWVRRSVVDDAGAWHPLGIPPDLRTGEPDEAGFVESSGIDIWATPSLDEVLEARSLYVGIVREVVDGLTQESLRAATVHNPPWIPQSNVIPVSACLRVVIREEWEHHGFAVRDLEVLEQQLRG